MKQGIVACKMCPHHCHYFITQQLIFQKNCYRYNYATVPHNDPCIFTKFCAIKANMGLCA